LTSKKPITYRDAGGHRRGRRARRGDQAVRETDLRPEVLAGIGGFGALAEIPKKYREPVLVSGTMAWAPS